MRGIIGNTDLVEAELAVAIARRNNSEGEIARHWDKEVKCLQRIIRGVKQEALVIKMQMKESKLH